MIIYIYIYIYIVTERKKLVSLSEEAMEGGKEEKNVRE
jgi:hypothetical protein